MPSWKRLVIISASAGAGFALTIALIVGGLTWYNSRPKPSKPWNTQAIPAKGPPGFTLSDDGKWVRFKYTLDNATDQDYSVANPENLRIMIRVEDRGLRGPLSPSEAKIDGPIFIPAHERAEVFLHTAVSSPPERIAGESEQDEHERLRAYLEKDYGHVFGFSLFDEATHYEIDLPRWLGKKPQ